MSESALGNPTVACRNPAPVRRARPAPLDELDDLAPPPPLPLIRFCGTPRCRRRARPGGRHCPACHAAAVRRWRERKRRAINTRRRDRAAARPDDQRIRDSARATLAMAIKRGKLAKGPCQICGTREWITAYQADPTRPLEVTWLCREDRRATVERIRAQAARAAAREAWEARRERAYAALALLPPASQAELAAAAARGPAGLTLAPESPLYREQLVRAVERVVNSQLANLEPKTG